MVTDGDDESAKFRAQILNRGFREDELAGRFLSLPQPNTLEDQLIADGNLQLLREVLAEIGGDTALTCPEAEIRSRLRNKKPAYMGVLSLRVASDLDLARRMPEVFVNLITSLRDGTA
jgi:putative ATP-dependent endonuclease of OLD family